jgi:hypothetical protein
MTDAHDAESPSRAYFSALLAGDSGLLDGLLDADFWLVEPLMGWKVSRKSLLMDVGCGALRFEQLDPSSLLVRVYADAVIVLGRVAMRGRLGECAFSLACRYTHVMIRLNGGWRIATAQETPIDAPTAG